MRCDLHVHTFHSGMSTLPLVGRFCRESYSPPEAVYEKVKQQGMDLVTVTDHDSIEASECLRQHRDFFVSEEITCRMPSGTELHVAAYDISEQQHLEIQRRRDDLHRLVAYLEEQRIVCSVQHAFSQLTGDRRRADFCWVEQLFPALEILNGGIPGSGNRLAARFAGRARKAGLGGSDSHTLSSLGCAYTEVPGARSQAEFLEALRLGRCRAAGEGGGYWRLTADVFRVTAAMWAHDHRTLLLSPLAVLIPAATFLSYLGEQRFASKWRRELEGEQSRRQKIRSRGARTGSQEALA